jgi:dihydrofolate synthase/folylpolyglutamate synthase
VSYPDSVRYLYALGNELKAGAKFGLDRMRTLLDALGNPERGRRFVHVAGTNGKGSTCAMIASILEKSGRRTGLYTSPHLIEPTERIQINRRPVTPERFAAAFDVVHACAESLIEQDRLDNHPTYFETVTAMAFCIFREECEIAVIEVGLGGRLDATNVIFPELSIITPISFDHEAFLGNTIELIAGEKAGILKPAIPAVIAKQDEQALGVIRQRASEVQSPLVLAQNIALSNICAGPRGSSFSLDGSNYICPLPGRHQISNAITAILASRQLGIPTDTIQSGLADARWPARLEWISAEPDLIIDGAHNPAGASALAAYIREFFSARPVWLVYAAMRDKAIEEVTDALFPLAERLIVTAPDFPRALRPEAILEMHSHPNATVARTVADAIDLARTAPPEAAVFFAGSLYLAGEARALLLG